MVCAGGIPERTEVCATIDAATYGTLAVDASAAIQQAIVDCPTSADAPAVVEIPAGNYLIGTTIDPRPDVVHHNSRLGRGDERGSER